MNVLFMPWFLFNWMVELKPPGREEFVATTFAEAFLSSELANLTSDEQRKSDPRITRIKRIKRIKRNNADAN